MHPYRGMALGYRGICSKRFLTDITFLIAMYVPSGGERNNSKGTMPFKIIFLALEDHTDRRFRRVFPSFSSHTYMLLPLFFQSSPTEKGGEAGYFKVKHWRKT